MKNKRTMIILAVTLATISLVALGFPMKASADLVSWDDGGGSDKWSQKKNWDPNGVPTGGDVVSIGSGYSVNYDKKANGDLSSLTLTGSNLNLTTSGTTLQSTILTVNDLSSLNQSAGTLNMNAGTISTLGAYNLSGGTLSAGTLTNNGTFNRTGGTLNFDTFNQTNGTSIFTDSGSILTINNGKIYNLSGGSLTADTTSNSGAFNFSGGAMTSTLNNSGTSTLSAAGGNITGAVTNTGTFDIQNGSNASATSYTQTDGMTIVNGTLTAPVSMSGGILQGSGSIIGDVSVSGGNVGPGNSPGMLSVTGDYIQSGGILNIQLSSISDYDQLNIDGTADLGGAILQIELLPGYSLAIGDQFEIITATGGITNPFTAYTLTGSLLAGPVTGFEFVTSGNSMFLSAVPIPASLWLLAAGLIGLVGVRRRIAVHVS
ncbi:MAG: VPLPA-CTERM sorting domain-containing protein [Pseudomonadota bacterium]